MPEFLDLERGKRMREIRDLREESQVEFAEAINQASRRKEFRNFPHLNLTFNDISKRETGTKSLEIADMLCLAYLDPKERGWFWVMWGSEVAIGKDAWAIISGRRRSAGDF
jgi:hypothetical protein